LYTLVIANCDANCVQATSHNQAFRSGEVTIPAGFVVASGTLNVSATGSKPWSASVSGTTIILGANGGNNGLSAGESLTLTFNATAPCASGAYAWTTAVYQDTLSQSGAVQPGTPYSLVGSQPSLEVSGGCSTQLLPGQYCSYSQGGWGAPPHGDNPGQILSSNFVSVYTSGLTVGSGNWMHFTSAAAIQAYLPAGGTPGVLTGMLTDPTSASAGVYGGQVLALRLNVDLNKASIISGTGGSIGSLKLKGTGTSLDGQTVSSILTVAEAVLGGAPLPAGYSALANLSTLVANLNEAFENGGNCIPSDWAQAHLTAQ